MRQWALLLAAATACALPRPLDTGGSKVGRPVAVAAPDLSGRTVDVAADAGRVRIVDFWATWCEPCRDELPALDQLLREEGSRGLAVYAVSFDEDAQQIPKFLEQVPVGFPVLWDKGGDKYSGAYGIERLPTTLVVDRKGVIRFVHQGYDPDTGARTRREVDQLLAEPP